MALAVGVPTILLKLGFGFLRFKVKRRRAVRVFRRALRRGGMGREAAQQLAADYASIGRLRSYIPTKGIRIPFRLKKTLSSEI